MTGLAVEQVSKSFGGLRVLSDISFTVAEGETVGIMGANGAGKTTLFSLIAGHGRPDGGDIRLGSRSLLGLSPDRICRMGIARTFQIVKPFGGLTVLDNVVVAALYGNPERPSQREAET
ncbi:MAG: ATP-binding cassette domain-containing protein, partial [Dongiales bacterium]